MEAPKVLALVVTYNRLELLKRCVQYLQAQTVKPDILIVNNSSPDDTEAWLKSEGLDFITQPNGGSSAGWKTGIDEGLARQYDFLWMMDDDGYPHPHALETLLANVREDTALISSVVVKENAPDEFVFSLPVVNAENKPVIFAKKRKYHRFSELPEGIRQYPFAHLFNGALLNLKAAAKIGTVNTDYFIYGDEVDYYCRLQKAGRVHYQLDAVQFHPDISKRITDKAKVYYFIRNTIINNNRYFDRPTLRNLLTVGVALARLAKRDGVLGAASYLVGSNSKYVWNGIRDGLNRRFIKRF